jgi:hypothetical protein
LRPSAAVVAILLVAFSSTAAPKAPPGTSRDAKGILHDDADGRFAKDPCAVGEDGTAAMRRQLRRALQCTDSQQAHHVVPLELRKDPVLVEAIKRGGDLNGAENGLCLSEKIHSTCHPDYTRAVAARLVVISKSSKAQLVPKLKALIDELKRDLRARRKALQ